MMAIKPVGFRVLIKPDPIEEVSEGGIVLHAGKEAYEYDKLSQVYGTVVDIGPTAWVSYDKDYSEWKPWVSIGDRISYSRFGGKFIIDPETKEEFVIINDSDVTAKILPPINAVIDMKEPTDAYR